MTCTDFSSAFLIDVPRIYDENILQVAIVHGKILVHANTVGLRWNKPAGRFSIVHYSVSNCYADPLGDLVRCLSKDTRTLSTTNILQAIVREAGFILDRLAEDAGHFAILEANGGATFWGTSVTDVSKDIMPFEEAAYFTALAETIGGSREFGRGVLEQQ